MALSSPLPKRGSPPLPFMRRRFIAFFVTFLMAAASVASLAIQGLNLGLDFRGGFVIEAKAPPGTEIAAVRTRLAAQGFGTAAVQLADQGSVVIVRLPPVEGIEAGRFQQIKDKVLTAIGPDATALRADVVGPKVSEELLIKGLTATGLSVAVISVYVWVRFEAKFGLAALITTFHDVLVTVGLFSLTRMTFDLAIVAALLTLAGYSINDTVVVFDRIRENLRNYRKMPLPDLIDRSVTATLRRTLATSGTTLMTSVALLLLGGPVLFGFAAAITFGILIGTYSSIFVAAPLLIHLPGRLPGRAEEAETTPAGRVH